VILHDAATAFITVIDTALLWVQVLAGAAAMVLCALPLCVAPGVKAARRALDARRSAEHAPQAPAEPTSAVKRRPVPSWAHTEPYDYNEAA
jgi:hypothetical protein